MALTYTLRSNNQIFTGDGFTGHFDGTANWIIGGWASGTDIRKSVYKSTDGGITWVAQADYAYRGHCMAHCKKGNDLYIVGGDEYTASYEGRQVTDSYKLSNGVWTQMNSDCGIGNRVFGDLVNHEGNFYYIGGQTSHDPVGTPVFHTVLKSTDNCANFTVVNADTTAQFKGGNRHGSTVSYGGLMWKILGGLYHDDISKREYITSIYSSPDGVTWTYKGEFPGYGRQYHQTIVWNNRIYLFNGFNASYGWNLDDVWSAEMVGDKLKWRYEGTSDWGNRHALTIWETNEGLMMFGGTRNASPTATQECWLVQNV